MIKAVFFDVDGTLLSHTTKSVPQSTRRALTLLREKGIAAVVATGRHMSELMRLPVKDISFDSYITLNGQLCLDGEKRLLSGCPIDQEDLARLITRFEERKIPLMLVEEDGMYINFIDETVARGHEAISTPLPAIGTYSGKPVYQAIAYVHEGEEGQVLEGLEHCIHTRWCAFGIDIISDTGGKASGILKFLEQNQLTREEIMAFGDGENDREMLCFAGIGVAMANGAEAVKQAADYVTASVDDDGILKALEHFGII